MYRDLNHAWSSERVPVTSSAGSSIPRSLSISLSTSGISCDPLSPGSPSSAWRWCCSNAAATGAGTLGSVNPTFPASTCWASDGPAARRSRRWATCSHRGPGAEASASLTSESVAATEGSSGGYRNPFMLARAGVPSCDGSHRSVPGSGCRSGGAGNVRRSSGVLDFGPGCRARDKRELAPRSRKNPAVAPRRPALANRANAESVC